MFSILQEIIWLKNISMKYKFLLAALLILPLQTKVFGQTSAHTTPLGSKTLAPAQVTLNWNNQTGSDITIHWVNLEGKTQEGTLVKPGEAYKGISYAGHVFRVFLLDKDRQSQILPTITVSADNASAPIKSTMSLRSKTLNPAEVPLNWVNQTDEDLVIHWVDYEGHMQGGQVVKPGEAYRGISYAGHVFRVFPKVMTSQKQEYWPLIVSAAPLPASTFLKGFTGPTTKRELNITLPFAKAQKLTVEVANDGTVIFERDMIVGNLSDFTKQDVMLGKVSDFTRKHRPACDAVEANPRIWPNSTIPYSLNTRHGKRDEILAAIKEINSKTNLCLVPRTNETDYVEFVSKNGHWSKVGRVGGRQEISIDQSESFVPMGTAVHEIMHAAGFGHTQSREDRDRYVTINDRNIVSGQEHNFQRLMDKSSNIGPYDFGSIMHYSAKAFSSNGRNTIDLIGVGDSSRMGQYDGLSSADVATVAAIYAPAPCKKAGEKPTAPKPPQPTAPKPPQPTAPKPPQPTAIKPPQPTATDNAGNIAIGKKARQSGSDGLEYQDAKKAIDGNTDGRFSMGSVTQTGEGRYLFWEIDLGAVYDVSRIVIWNRTDEGFRDLQQNFLVATTDEAFFRDRMGNNDKDNLRMALSTERNSVVGNLGPFSPWSANRTNYTVPINRKARWIRISTHAGDGKILPGLSLAEVQVFGTPLPVPGIRKR